MRIRLALIVSLLALNAFTSLHALAQDEMSVRIAPTIATILTRNDEGRFEPVGSGVFVRNDGVLLTAYNLVRGAREIQVRLADGETYDKVEVVTTDERRNVALLRIYAVNTPFVGVGAADESAVGAQVRAIYNAGGQVTIESCGVLSAISLADEISGAGTGFRVLKFTEPLAAKAAGGILVDNYGRVIGLIAPLPQARTQNYAVPLYNVVGLVRLVVPHQSASLVLAPGTRELNRAVPVWQPSTTPLAPMPQVAVPQRPTTALAPAGPGSSVVRETNPAKLLVGSRTLYVTSSSNLFKPVQLVNELRKKREFTDWDLSFVDEREVADLVLEIEHVPLTWEFPFSIRHQRTGIVVATGKIYAWGGGDGALLMASRVVEKLTKVRAGIKIENKTENNTPSKQ
ncbi:MAG TPA: serine protease [Pyrinomonadaceae bacterium]